MKWSQWKIGLAIAVITGLAQGTVAAATAEAFSWRSVVVPVLFNIGTNLGLYLKQHPPEGITTDTIIIERTTTPGPPADPIQK